MTRIIIGAIFCIFMIPPIVAGGDFPGMNAARAKYPHLSPVVYKYVYTCTGGDLVEVNEMLAIGQRESGLQNVTGDGGRSFGPFQINETHAGKMNPREFLDLRKGTAAAVKEWRECKRRSDRLEFALARYNAGRSKNLHKYGGWVSYVAPIMSDIKRGL